MAIKFCDNQAGLQCTLNVLRHFTTEEDRRHVAALAFDEEVEDENAAWFEGDPGMRNFQPPSPYAIVTYAGDLSLEQVPYEISFEFANAAPCHVQRPDGFFALRSNSSISQACGVPLMQQLVHGLFTVIEGTTHPARYRHDVALAARI